MINMASLLFRSNQTVWMSVKKKNVGSVFFKPLSILEEISVKSELKLKPICEALSGMSCLTFIISNTCPKDYLDCENIIASRTPGNTEIVL